MARRESARPWASGLQFLYRGTLAVSPYARGPSSGRNGAAVRPRIFSLMIVGFDHPHLPGSGPMWKACSWCFGLFLGCMGMDTIMGTVRFNFGLVEMSDGFGSFQWSWAFRISEVLLNVEQTAQRSYLRQGQNCFHRQGWRDSIGRSFAFRS